MTTQAADMISILTHDHQEVEELFGQLEAARPDDGETRRRLTDQVIIELVRHSVAEEMYLYPATRRHLPDGDEIADKELADHDKVERIMKDLEKTDAVGREFSDLLASLMTEVRLHVHDEEENLFPQLARHCDHAELAELGEKIQKAKDKAPTRPHPSTPDSPTLLKLLAPGAGLVDRARDRLSGRGK
ncbi:hemerythrin domain-containing protein [Actinomadura sp. NPDC047616]|uniref:hemerythrin domain-containing protein n=1 Tax=Actinomadura sp. NPDC047616 TaxID=3155914 RepID=UPI0033E39349